MHGKENKHAFATRLRAALAQAGVRGSTQLALKFNLRYAGQPVSTQAAHKWLSGNAVPTDDKILTMANWLGVDPHWLRYGAPEDMKQIATVQPESRFDLSAEDAALLDIFHRLDTGKKRLVKALLRALSQG